MNRSLVVPSLVRVPPSVTGLFFELLTLEMFAFLPWRCLPSYPGDVCTICTQNLPGLRVPLLLLSGLQVPPVDIVGSTGTILIGTDLKVSYLYRPYPHS